MCPDMGSACYFTHDTPGGCVGVLKNSKKEYLDDIGAFRDWKMIAQLICGNRGEMQEWDGLQRGGQLWRCLQTAELSSWAQFCLWLRMPSILGQEQRKVRAKRFGFLPYIHKLFFRMSRKKQLYLFFPFYAAIISVEFQGDF